MFSPISAKKYLIGFMGELTLNSTLINALLICFLTNNK